MQKIKVFSSYPHEDPSFRLRIKPIIGRLKNDGFHVEVDSLFTSHMYRIRNKSILHKSWSGLLLGLRMFLRLFRIFGVGQNDIIIIHREIFPFFTPVLERIACGRSRFSVLDFDDAIYEEPSHGSDWRRFFRRASNFAKVVSSVDLVLVASPVLVEWVLDKNPNCLLVLTFPPEIAPASWDDTKKLDIVWIGSDSNEKHLRSKLGAILSSCVENENVLRVLSGHKMLKAEWSELVRVQLWSESYEADLLSDASLGVMPLIDDPWARGKGSYKILQYMSAGIPFVASPVGMNVWLAEDSNAGMLAQSDAEWLDAISYLSSNRPAAYEFGLRGKAWLDKARTVHGLDPAILLIEREALSGSTQNN